MKSEAYLSVFSGIGGLEHPFVSPLLFCEQDEACRQILQAVHPGVPIVPDVRSLHEPPHADVVIGGWPCQDISSAGNLGGIRAARSSLFFEMLRVAKSAGAHSLIGENVPNLLTINKGVDFRIVLDTLLAEGYPYISWRILNARQFGLPQQRRRLFIVASRDLARAEAIHTRIPSLEKQITSNRVFAFYWTAGKRSICLCDGYAPTIKIGATDNKGRAPVAVLIGDQIRKLSARECLRLQGFDELHDQHSHLSRSTLLRMAGNAVPRPMGRFVVQAVSEVAVSNGMRTAFGILTDCGLYENGLLWSINHVDSPLASNLADFLDPTGGEFLSSQAAAGLLARSIRAGQPMPIELFDLLRDLAARRSGALRPSRTNSFEILDGMANEIANYRASLDPITEWSAPVDDDL